MGIIRRNQAAIRWVVAALWLLGVVAAISSETLPLLYVLLVLALLSFLLVDYFSSFVIALLLTIVMKTLYPDQVSGVTRALLIDAVWLAALVVVAIKVLKPITNHAMPEPDIPVALPVTFRHDLLTPVRMILGFSNAILRADNHGSAIPLAARDNVQAIYRNAQQLEKMLGDFLSQLKTVPTPESEEIDPATVIQEAVTLTQALMTTHQITLQVKLDDPLPQLVLHRITLRQLLLNVLRTLALVTDLPTRVTMQAHVQQSALHITFTTLSTIIHRAMADANWSMNERLLEKVGGRLWVEAVPHADGNLILALPLPSSRSSVWVVSEETSVIDLFKEYLTKYEIIGVKDINRLSVSAAQPATVILTRQQQTPQMQAISELVGKLTPIITCSIATAEERLRRLHAVYLPKPVDYDALYNILTSAKLLATNILIVDDNNDSADMLAQMLSAMSPTVVSRKSRLAKEALVLLDQHPIGAIILDIYLPDMDGVALAQLIRSNERFVHIPIVLVSAHQSLDFMTPIIDKISVVQSGGFAADRLATLVEALIT